MGSHSFDRVSGDYGHKSLVQLNAAQKLIRLLELCRGESVLDVGCGPGHITRQLTDITGGRVVGTDISGGMIEEARAEHPGIEFRRLAAEDLDYREEFDVVFCNSAFQWFTDGPGVARSMRDALVAGGRLGLACPSTPDFAPWFLDVVAAVAGLPKIEPTYAHRRNPWFHLPDMPAYQSLFEEAGFTTRYIELEHEVTEYTVDEAFGVFSTGAAQGFIGRECYDVEITDDYLEEFHRAVRAEMESRAEVGKVEVDFNRLYYVGKY
jgi:trans-aconitate methyltransferase